ncbi:type I polyketide synthase [Streptantibioticus cattleyicolor]|uniref:Beta-ketoacyl synthase n=1 Tax=Streptantibioticus cattleyicolor (strain ATCC 35852 / DSM 46488 / JCM 4925 / NBRC 14057 / NRRL 8057) TaxID=1003195 RepID=F8JL89_STREN|nr:type I polyketide synthase [Streptantibioticus cattleyicolor]AEW99625.1 Beta-ketoacyl synthase [Streptantibioticus cattleyicolor NRRL 8057 = DSM 46488]CCB71338.1 Putative polyketide synthase family protein [Streptantibioticus cattleyicolor NRRL 8057 = DSM 46488]
MNQPLDDAPQDEAGTDIALVGMAGRFPGASGVRALWRNLTAGRDTITRFTEARLRAAGVPEDLLADPAYVRAGSVLTGIDRFDAGFFGYPPSEAAVLDPQQRLFLENAWYALEDAAVDPGRFDGSIGVVAGAALSSYLTNNLFTRPELADTFGEVQVGLANDKDSLATRVAYALDLTGPAFSVQSYCSTSLVAVCAACSALAGGEADLMLAGGVSVNVPHEVGYLHQEAGMTSPDGTCRAFDAAARGTPVGSGVGVVALRRLEDALADGDRIYAVIRGWAVGNDGADKAGFTAPGVRGQAGVMAEALAAAGLGPADVDYIEAHGTGTRLGDAVEIAAIQRVYDVPEVTGLGIGSVKTNLGHLDRAAGVTGLIKTALALHHERIPATLHHERANPQLAASGERITVVGEERPWPRGERPRRAGVSAFGIGGTNAHVIVEEAPRPRAAGPLPARRHQVMVWSARSEPAADAYTGRLRAALTAAPDDRTLADVAHTLQSGRALFGHRRATVVDSVADAGRALGDDRDHRVLGRAETRDDRPVGFLLAGVGEHYRGMAAEIHAEEPVFAEALDECGELFTAHLGRNPVQELLLGERESGGPDLARLMGRGGAPAPERAAEDATEIAQPAVFALDYALGRLLLSWGLRPRVLLGYSVGEFAAACLSGSLTPAEATGLVATRARLIARLPGGVMTAVGLSVGELTDKLGPLSAAGIDVAAVNGPRFTVLSGPADAVERTVSRLAALDVPCRELRTTHAFHSATLRPAAPELTAWARANLEPRPPRIPYLSNVTGKVITERQLADPAYWSDHMCSTVRFADMLGEVLTGEDLLIELGAGQSLGAMARNHPDCPRPQWPLLLPTLPAQGDPASGTAVLARTVAQAWLTGATVDWDAYRRDRDVRRTTAPDYPFQRQSYWIDADPARTAPVTTGGPAADTTGPELFAPAWSPAPLPAGGRLPDGPVWIAAEDGPAVTALTARLAADGRATTVTRPGEDYRALLEHAPAPGAVVHLAGSGDGAFDELRALTAALGDAGVTADVLVVTEDARAVLPGDRVVPERAAVFGPALVAPQEYDTLAVRTLDVSAPDPDALAGAVLAELAADVPDHVVALRDGVRLTQGYVPVTEAGTPEPVRLGPGDVCLVTGGLGPVGLLLAGHLGALGVHVVLAGRTGLPDEADWPALLADPATTTALRARIEGVRALRGRGVRVEVVAVDVTDTEALTTVLAGVRERHGRLDGVFHLAAVTDPRHFAALSDLGPEQRDAHLSAKAGGARALDAALAVHPARFCVFFSSMSSVLGGLAFAGYAAANAVLDAWANAPHDGPTRRLAVDWDTWATTAAAVGDQALGASLAQYSLTEREALDALDAVLARPLPRTLVCAGDLPARLARWVDRRRPAPAPAAGTTRFPRPELAQPYVPPKGDHERRLAELWGELLGLDRVGARDNFADLGGTSLMALQLVKRIRAAFGVAVSPVTLFEAPTVHAMARLLGQPSAEPATPPVPAPPRAAATDDDPIAVIGVAGRFPGAADTDAFWANLSGGVESVTRFTEEELLASGVPAERVHDPDYVPARPVLDDIRSFDAEFFGYSPRDAAITDPQHRLFLECCWEALERGGYGARDGRGRVGVFGGTNLSTYLMRHAATVTGAGEADVYSSVIGNDKDSLATGVSYKLGLTGPSLSVQTFCSTALVGVHLACQSLRAGECELALAGGVGIHVPDRVGHQYTPGGMESPDGKVRAFDARAGGTLFGDGAGVVLLKRLSAARADGDTVLAVIRGSAVNNDGALKVGYTAPSVVGQATVVAQAMAAAGVTAEDVSYVEAHGTATPLGDPIEIAALTKAFGPTERRGYCPIGSVKTNIGHLGAAAGATGLIKTVLSLRHRQIPPSLNYTEPSPDIDFAASPFFVNTELRPWQPPEGRPRIAGVNSLGMGGTNVHVVLQEAPEPPPAADDGPGPARRYEVLPVSARTEAAADQAVRNLREHLRRENGLRPRDVAFTLQAGRERFEHRRALVTDAPAALGAADDPVPGPLRRADTMVGRPVAFLFAGVGEQYPGMIADLYEREPVFRTVVDECAALLRDDPAAAALPLLTSARRPAGDGGLAALLGRAEPDADPAARELARTELAQPAMFVAQYALARLLMSWGLEPVTMAGYSLGEYVAACLAGVLTLPEALRLVAYRARLISRLPTGAMAAVPLTPAALTDRFGDPAAHGLDVAVLNGPEQTVLGGTPEAVEAWAARLTEAGVPVRRLATTHAFHTRMMAPAADELTAWVRANVRPRPPERAYLSDVTGGPATAELVTDPGYWARHLCSTVRFAEAVEALLADPDPALVELGPGQSLGAMVRAHPGCPRDRWPLIVPTLPAASDPRPGDAALADALARLWLAGADVDWAAHHADRAPRRIPLPTYPFQRRDHWLEAPAATPAVAAAGGDGDGDPRMPSLPRLPEEEWLHAPVWRRTATPGHPTPTARWLLFTDHGPADELAAPLARRLTEAGGSVVRVRPDADADGPRRVADDEYTVHPGDAAQLRELLRTLRGDGGLPERAVHLWTLSAPATGGLATALEHGNDTLIALATAANDVGLLKWSLDVVTTGTRPVTGTETVRPELATVSGPVRGIPLEYPGVVCRLIDVEPPAGDAGRLAGLIAAELGANGDEPVVALRNGRRWLPGYEPVPLAEGHPATPLREGGVYLVTGGLGGIGLAMAERLAAECRARLVLFGRTGLPPRELWPEILADPAAGDEVRRRLTGVLRLEERGAQVAVVTGDVADEADAHRAVRAGIERWGALHGVLHAAGLPGIGLMQFKTTGDMRKVMAPKIDGTLALEAALREVPLDFLCLFSSITSATGGGPGQVDYSAANAFLDAYACAADQGPGGRRTVAIGWGEWTWNAWEAGLAGYDAEVRAFFRENRARFGIGFDEGWRALLRALTQDEPYVVVNTQDFAQYVRISRDFTVDAVGGARVARLEGGRHPRPDLVTPYVLPAGPTQRAIAEVWSDLLGVENVGADDNFFDLGGSSLIGMEVMARVRRRLGVEDLAPHVLYEAPTVASLARFLAAAGAVADGEAQPAGTADGDDERARGEQRRRVLRRGRAREGERA